MKSWLRRPPGHTGRRLVRSVSGKASATTISPTCSRARKERIIRDPRGRQPPALRRGKSLGAPRKGAQLVGQTTERLRRRRVVLAGADDVHSHWHQRPVAQTSADIEGSHRARAKLDRSALRANHSSERTTLGTVSKNAPRGQC